MKNLLLPMLVVCFLASSCGTQAVTCPTYENDYVYTPRKVKAVKSKKKPKKVVRAEQ